MIATCAAPSDLAARVFIAILCFCCCLSLANDVRGGDQSCPHNADRRSLRKLFYSNELSRLSSTEVLLWMQNCAGVDVTYISANLEAFQHDLSGLALWDICVVQKEQYFLDLKIDHQAKAAIISAFCQELQSRSCWPSQGKHVQDRHKDSETLLTLRDRDGDHRLSQSEMLVGPSSTNQQADQLFKSFDKDGDSFLSRKELSRLKKDFFRSRLSHLSGEEVKTWLGNPLCFSLADEISSKIQALDTTELSGLALWDFAILRPKQLGKVLGIDDARAQSMIQLAVLREINGKGGCLTNSSYRGWIVEFGASVILLLVGLVIRLWSSKLHDQAHAIELSEDYVAFLNDPKKKRWTWPVRQASAKKRVRFSDERNKKSELSDVWWMLVVVCGAASLLSHGLRTVLDWSGVWQFHAAELSLNAVGYLIASSCIWHILGAQNDKAD